MIKHAKFQDSGTMAAATVTANFQTLLSLADDSDMVLVMNTLDQPIVLQFPNESGTADVTIPYGTSWTADFRTNSKMLAKGIIKIKALSSLPASGIISILAIR